MENYQALETEVGESLDRNGFSGLQRGIALLRLLLGEWKTQNLSKERLFAEAMQLWDRKRAASGGGGDLYGQKR